MPCERESLEGFTSEQLSDLLEEHVRAVIGAVRDQSQPPARVWDRADEIWREFRRRHTG